MTHPHKAEWAGYKPDGMDYERAHLHPHPAGPFIRHDGIRGWSCVAPTEGGICQDPNPGFLKTLKIEYTEDWQHPSIAEGTTPADYM